MFNAVKLLHFGFKYTTLIGIALKSTKCYLYKYQKGNIFHRTTYRHTLASILVDVHSAAVNVTF